jgi:hypothetical protein
MACAPGSSCCEDCATDGGIDAAATAERVRAQAKYELVASTRSLVYKAEEAVAESGQCGILGEVQDVTGYLFGDSESISSDELCERQNASLTNLRLGVSQLEEMLAQGASEARIVAVLDAIETNATGLVDEAALSSWATFARMYAKNVGSTVGGIVGGALDAAAEGALGLVGGIGLGWVLIGVAVAVVYFNPGIVAKVRA